MIPPEVLREIETRGYLTPNGVSQEAIEESARLRDRDRRRNQRNEANRRRRKKFLTAKAAEVADLQARNERWHVEQMIGPEAQAAFRRNQARATLDAWIADPDRQADDLMDIMVRT